MEIAGGGGWGGEGGGVEREGKQQLVGLNKPPPQPPPQPPPVPFLFAITHCSLLYTLALQVSFTGTIPQVNSAFQLIFNALLRGDPSALMPGPGLPGVCVKLQVTDNEAGAIIGRGGEGIRKLRTDTGVNVKVTPTKEMPPEVRGEQSPDTSDTQL